MNQSKPKLLWVGVFLVFLLPSSNVFAAPTVETLGGVARKIGEGIDNFFTTAAKSSNPKIDKEFNKTLDEILEMKRMDREELPETVLIQLREATMDPTRLIVQDQPGNNPFHYFLDHEHSDIYRAFFQKRLDFNNDDHMESLMVSVHGVAEETGMGRNEVLSAFYRDDHPNFSERNAWAEDLYASLYSTAMKLIHVDDLSTGGKEPFHAFVMDFKEALQENRADDYIINPHFQLPEIDPHAGRNDIPLVETGRRDPLEDNVDNFEIGEFENNSIRLDGNWVDEANHRKTVEETVFKYVAANPERFIGRMADDPRTKDAVLRFWEHRPFRRLVFWSIGRDNRHLLSDWEFLLKFWEEAKSVNERMMNEGTARFATFLSASFKNAHHSYNVGMAKHDDVFWNTALRASNESDDFSRELAVMLRSLFGEPSRASPRSLRHTEFPI